MGRGSETQEKTREKISRSLDEGLMNAIYVSHKTCLYTDCLTKKHNILRAFNRRMLFSFHILAIYHRTVYSLSTKEKRYKSVQIAVFVTKTDDKMSIGFNLAYLYIDSLNVVLSVIHH